MGNAAGAVTGPGRTTAPCGSRRVIAPRPLRGRALTGSIATAACQGHSGEHYGHSTGTPPGFPWHARTDGHATGRTTRWRVSNSKVTRNLRKTSSPGSPSARKPPGRSATATSLTEIIIPPNASRPPRSAVNADKVAPLPRTLQVVPQPLRGCHTHRGDQRPGIDEQRTRHFGRKRDHDDGHAVTRHKGYPVRVVPGQNTITASESGSVTGPAKKTAVRTPGCARAKANSSA